MDCTTRTIILNQGDAPAKRREIRDYFHATWETDEKLLDHLRHDSSFTLRADPLRHPLIFYFGHTAAFYINKLMLAGLIRERVNPDFESMFSVGVDEMSWDDLTESHYAWPSRQAVKAYRDRVRQRVDALMASLELTMPIDWHSPWWVIMMGIEHARIHLETSSVLIRQLPLDQVQPVPCWRHYGTAGTAPANSLLAVPDGRVRLGKDFSHPLYGWDNEFGRHTAAVAGFKASQYLVSNREFLDFVTDEGYATRQWWTEEGWNWRTFKQAHHPLFWRKLPNEWRLRLVAEEIALPWNWPVEVNYLEAKAFCNWKAAQTGLPIRLPTEDEWYRLRDLAEIPDQPGWPSAPGNVNLEHYGSPCPVDEFAFGSFYDVIGNVWQWTETPTYPFDGFAVHPVYDDFTTPTFDNKHNLIKGGSWISTGNEATRDSRYAFRRHFFQHAGLRYVQSDAPVTIAHAPYECEPEVCQSCELHYGASHLGTDNFPVTVARRCEAAMGSRPRRRALDLGCGAGRASFELARTFERVTGMDLTARIMRMGDGMKREGRIRYRLAEEGELEIYREATLEQFGLGKDQADKVEFWQGDPCNLKQPELFRDYDLVLVQDLLTRLYDPARFLRQVAGQMTGRGLLAIVTTNQWESAAVEKSSWVGGYRKNGEPFSTLEGLQTLLAHAFRRLGEPVDLPRVTRLTARTYRYDLAQMTLWEKIG